MNYAQLTITSVMQAQYNENIEEIAKTVVTNEKLAATLESTMKSMMASMIKSPAAGSPIDELLETLMDYDEEIEADLSNKAKAADYVLDALLPAVELWTEANLTAEETPDGAPYYLPFDFFWYKSGTVNADGTLMRPSGPVADRVLGNNEDLVDAVEGLIDEVINAVAAPIFDAYEEKYGIDFDDFENSIDKLLKDKINEKLDDATVAELQDEVVGTAASEMGTLKSTMNAEAKKVVKKAAMLEGATEAEFDLAWSMMSPAEQDAEIKKYMDVDALLVELFGTADSAALTVDHIDAAATYQAKSYDADVQSKINKATSAADLEKLMPDFKEMIKDETSEMLYETINTKVESKLAELISGNEMVAEMLGDDKVSRTYVKALVLNKMGFDSFIDVNVELSSGKTMKDQALANMADAIDKKINDAIEEERNAIITAEEVEDMLNGAVAEACGTYSEYLNKIGLINNFASLREDKLEELVWLLRDDMFLNLVGKVGAPQYVTKLGDVIAKLDSTGAVVKIAGKQVSGAVLDDVKTAGNVKELCAALADFLEIFEDMSINSFEEGVLVEVNDEQITLVLNIQK